MLLGYVSVSFVINLPKPVCSSPLLTTLLLIADSWMGFDRPSAVSRAQQISYDIGEKLTESLLVVQRTVCKTFYFTVRDGAIFLLSWAARTPVCNIIVVPAGIAWSSWDGNSSLIISPSLWHSLSGSPAQQTKGWLSMWNLWLQLVAPRARRNLGPVVSCFESWKPWSQSSNSEPKQARSKNLGRRWPYQK
ncbi:hypothetical protein CEXT_142471 [Caerostris extrusa]|uniref:Uncharacterized protein n=1 Tax=Caerostris extrusa TaxID=172846 RepID=A0AAV4UMB8_CAEEX|nr:hypothetical protein CEXT_142471 [Caerostris extrusa]